MRKSTRERRIHLREGEVVSICVDGEPHAHLLIGFTKEYLEVYLKAEKLGIDQSNRAVDRIKRNLEENMNGEEAVE